MIRGGGGAEWLVAGLSLLRSQLQITISEQFNIPHQHTTPGCLQTNCILNPSRNADHWSPLLLDSGHPNIDVRPVVLKSFVH